MIINFQLLNTKQAYDAYIKNYLNKFAHDSKLMV